jgi:multiple sugar transport system ATP-binding protein
MAALSIRGLRTKFGPVDVLKGIDLEIDSGDFTVLVGPSGCGKSTLLNIIAGLETATAGEIEIGERVVNDVAAKDRDIAMVFQSYALYPTMTVRQNITFGMECRHVPKAKQAEAVDRVARLLQIEPLLARKPGQLSGGQRQRVAMGRALVRDPKLFLFDEPLSNLDAKLRVEMRTQIKRLHLAFNATSLYVTHDQTEAMTLADRIVVLRSGIIEQVGTPNDLYNTPANKFVAGFIGSPTMNFLDATLVEGTGGPAVGLADGTTLPLPDAMGHRLAGQAGRSVTFGVRPEHLTNTWTAENRDGAGLVPMEIAVDILEPLGADTLVFSRIGDTEIVSRISSTDNVQPGKKTSVHVDMGRTHLFDKDTGVRL